MRAFITGILAAALWGAASASSYARERVALLIGNAAYENTPRLNNPPNDVAEMAALLRDFGFDVAIKTNLSRSGMLDALDTFDQKARNAQVALIFYSGHGFEIGGDRRTYLIPVDADMSSALTNRHEAIELSLARDAAGRAESFSLVIIDACRNNALPGSWRGSRGMGPVAKRPAQIVAYSAQPGQVAEDGDGNLSPYTEALAEKLRANPTMDLRILLSELGSVGRQQEPDYTAGHFPAGVRAVLGLENDDDDELVCSPAPSCAYVDTPAGFECYASEERVSIRPLTVAASTPDSASRPIQALTSTAAADPCANLSSPGWRCVPANGEATWRREPAPAAAAQTTAPALYSATAETAPAPPPATAEPATTEQASTTPATECDRLAASPYDASRPEGVNGVKLADINVPAAVAACETAVRRHPSAGRLFTNLGRAYDKDARYGEAMRRYRQAADLGEAAAMSNIGVLHHHGRGVAQSTTEAMHWWRQAANLGDAGAMFYIGVLYQDGRGVAQSATEAIRWWRRAADLGDAPAMTSLGYLYEKGAGGAQDYAEAIRWYRQAANHGETEAMNNIGVLYDKGLGVARDREEAARWLIRALRGGNEHTLRQTRDNVNGWESGTWRALQRQLRDAGVYTGPIDGNVASLATQAAIDAIFGQGE